MQPNEYHQLVIDTAQEFIDSDPVNGNTRPSSAFDEQIGDIVDRNWRDEDAFACLQFSDFPSAEPFNTGGYKPASQQQPFPFKAFALPAFAEDVKQAIGLKGLDLNEVEENWEATRNTQDQDRR
jgi:hypothetical protein